ncbi:DEAD/DEAH box helicase [Corynebacterium atypicum]|uniref:DEAD/DEAH box helicase n=1 Tax=Corynebacterium atypicum TaxID=191610 RepID=UPI0006893518|nr:DEAD/DEAH box helicase [Corynebacterium atypicum]
MFFGPYVRTRLPFKPAEDWQGTLDFLPDWFVPYAHQAEAFQRLRAFLPTVVVTGTGSGKTESFLYPILDHCRRQKAKGIRGIKAVILYPMNALAGDQERRLAELLTTFDEYAGITAGVFTGEATEAGAGGHGRTEVSEKGLITDQPAMRELPPDILLTNYKMLDYLVLRDADEALWAKSATSLRFMVLDEFHTYDGAQGTDVALLLRRLGLKLKAYQPDGFLTPEEEGRALGKVTPVATSATLGTGAGARTELLEFAGTVFGRDFDAGAIVGETTMSLARWQAAIPGIVGKTGTPTGMPTRADAVRIADQLAAAASAHAHEGGRAGADELTHEVLCRELFSCSTELTDAIAAASVNELVVAILQTTREPVALDGPGGLAAAVLPREVRRLPGGVAHRLLTAVLGEIAYLRTQWGASHGFAGKKLPGVEVHLWVRELSRLERAIGDKPEADSPPGQLFRFSDDGTTDKPRTFWLPACYCRRCGRSGWMAALTPGGDAYELSPSAIRRVSVRDAGLKRPLIDATSEVAKGAVEGDSGEARVHWFDPAAATLSSTPPTRPRSWPRKTAAPRAGKRTRSASWARGSPRCSRWR